MSERNFGFHFEPYQSLWAGLWVMSSAGTKGSKDSTSSITALDLLELVASDAERKGSAHLT